MRISYKEQRYEIMQEMALRLKEDYDETKSNIVNDEDKDFTSGYLYGVEMAFEMIRNRFLTYNDIDDDKLRKLGVASELCNVTIKKEDFYK